MNPKRTRAGVVVGAVAVVVASVATVVVGNGGTPKDTPGQVLVQMQGPGGRVLTSHGNDALPPPPKGAAPRQVREEPWPCEGTGTDSKRVQMLYVHGTGAADNLGTLRPTLESYARQVEGQFVLSAAETGGYRAVRMVTGPGCTLSIPSVAVSGSALADFDRFISELGNQGWNRPDRIYSAWVDGSSTYCGIGTWWGDDRAGSVNYANTGPAYSRSDRGQNCWNYSEFHEMEHNLGAVNDSAPNSTRAGHCNDEYDLMCYADGGSRGTMHIACADRAHDVVADCNHEDYFSTSPAPGSYLATHWNTAESPWLVRSATPTSSSTSTTTPPTTLPPPTTSTSVGRGETTTDLVMPTSVTMGTPVTAMATVSGDCGPEGTVAFYVSGRLLVKRVLTGGAASVTLQFQQVGRFTVRANYEGNSACAASKDSLRPRVRTA